MHDQLLAVVVRIREASQAELVDLEGDLWDEVERLADEVGEALDRPKLSSPKITRTGPGPIPRMMRGVLGHG